MAFVERVYEHFKSLPERQACVVLDSIGVLK